MALPGQMNETPPYVAQTQAEGKPTPFIRPTTQSKPTVGLPVSVGGYQNAAMQSQLQQGLPFLPNNGNPRGAHNTSPYRGEVPGLRRTRFGGGFIGAQPPAGSVLGARGVSFGRGALTESQAARNEQLVSEQENRNAMQSQMARAVQQFAPWGVNPQQQQRQQFDMAQYSQMNPQQSLQPYPQGPVYRGGQDPRLARYRPPQMGLGGEWNNDPGGYSYNLPNPFGPYPQFGQGPYGWGNGG